VHLKVASSTVSSESAERGSSTAWPATALTPSSSKSARRPRDAVRRSTTATPAVTVSVGVGIARYYVLVTWATVVALAGYLRHGVPAVWEKAEGTR
jgi:hypothetical protein